jgi:type II secretion system protein N
MKQWLRQWMSNLTGLSLPSRDKSRWIAVAVFLLLAGWWAGLFLFFPATSLETRIENEVASQLRGNGSLDLKGLSFSFPLGLSARQATLHLNRPPATIIPAIEFGVSPLWLSLLTGNPGLAYECELFDGSAEGFLRRNGEIHLELQGLHLALPLLEGSPLTLTGALEQGELSAQWPLVANSENHLSLNIMDARITGLKAIGSTSEELKLGTLVLQGNGTGNAFKIDRLEAKDGELTVTGSGTLLLADPIERSRINLIVTLKPTPALNSQLLELLGMFVQEDSAGDFPLRISGTLSRPQVQ